MHMERPRVLADIRCQVHRRRMRLWRPSAAQQPWTCVTEGVAPCATVATGRSARPERREMPHAQSRSTSSARQQLRHSNHASASSARISRPGVLPRSYTSNITSSDRVHALQLAAGPRYGGTVGTPAPGPVSDEWSWMFLCTFAQTSLRVQLVH